MDSPTAPATSSSNSPVTSSSDPVNGAAADDTVIDSDLLVEEISIDGMCGVY
jgi:mycofactocin precursor